MNIAALKQAVTLEAVLRHYQVDDLAGGRSGRYRGRCPIHQGEGRDAFHVDVRRKIFHCFSCGAGGDVLDLVALLSQCTLREAALPLQDWLPGAATRRDRPARQRVTKENICDNPPLRFTLRGVDGSDVYWAAREIHAGTVARFGVGFYRVPRSRVNERTGSDSDSRRAWAVGGLGGSRGGWPSAALSFSCRLWEIASAVQFSSGGSD